MCSYSGRICLVSLKTFESRFLSYVSLLYCVLTHCCVAQRVPEELVKLVLGLNGLGEKL